MADNSKSKHDKNDDSFNFASEIIETIEYKIIERLHQSLIIGKEKYLPLRVGTRSSPLALVQTRSFLTRLSRFCPVLRDMRAFEEVQIKTIGDRNLRDYLSSIGGKGLFSKEIHDLLLEKKIDMAVHSLKDLETHLPDGLTLACTLKREDPRDALILRNRSKEFDSQNPYTLLPKGALIGCASVRRKAQMLHQRPDLRFCLLRGNVQTRLDKLNANDCDATLLAIAGLNRLDMSDRIDIALSPLIMLPAAGQGVIGITVRKEDEQLRELLSLIEDPMARITSTAERALQKSLDGSCRSPIGAYAKVHGDKVYLDAMVASEDGEFLIRRHINGSIKDAEKLGIELGRNIKHDLPKNILDAILNNNDG